MCMTSTTTTEAPEVPAAVKAYRGERAQTTENLLRDLTPLLHDAARGGTQTLDTYTRTTPAQEAAALSRLTDTVRRTVPGDAAQAEVLRADAAGLERAGNLRQADAGLNFLNYLLQIATKSRAPIPSASTSSSNPGALDYLRGLGTVAGGVGNLYGSGALEGLAGLFGLGETAGVAGDIAAAQAGAAAAGAAFDASAAIAAQQAAAAAAAAAAETATIVGGAAAL